MSAGGVDADSARVERGDGSGQAGKDVPQDNAGNAGRNAARPDLTVRAIIRTAELVIETKNPAAAADRAAGLVETGDGYVSNQQSSTGVRAGRRKVTSVHLVLRVPVDDFDRVAGGLKDLGTVTRDKQDATDVTEEVVDVESRVANQRKSIERLRALLGEAKTVGEVIQVESELTTREAELESLQARYSALSAQAALSTISVILEAPAAGPRPASKDDSGFLVGLSAGWNAFVAVVQALLTAFGALMPFVIGLGLVLVPAWAVLTRVRARRRDSTPKPAPSTTATPAG